MRAERPTTALPGHHTLFVYEDDADFVDRIGTFLAVGADDGEVGFASVSARKWALLEEALGDAASRIRYLDHELVYTRPEAVLATYDAVLREGLSGRAPAGRLFGEFPGAVARANEDAWVVYEAIVSHAFTHLPISMMCGYDRREQPAALIEAAEHTHTMVLADGWRDNPAYRDAGEVVGALTPRPQALSGLRELPVDHDPGAFRDRLRRELIAMHVPEGQADDLLVAATQVFDNARSHGNGARSQRLGRVGGRLVWELSDNGPGFDDPLAGHVPPRSGDAAGRGLWVARQHTRGVDFIPSPDGFTTRLWV
jgi:anti-sigma regulatory factor (Ser/Thr protein kinase)